MYSCLQDMWVMTWDGRVNELVCRVYTGPFAVKESGGVMHVNDRGVSLWILLNYSLSP